jgi:hypothetical protein
VDLVMRTVISLIAPDGSQQNAMEAQKAEGRPEVSALAV